MRLIVYFQIIYKFFIVNVEKQQFTPKEPLNEVVWLIFCRFCKESEMLISEFYARGIVKEIKDFHLFLLLLHNDFFYLICKKDKDAVNLCVNCALHLGITHFNQSKLWSAIFTQFCSISHKCLYKSVQVIRMDVIFNNYAVNLPSKWQRRRHSKTLL